MLSQRQDIQALEECLEQKSRFRVVVEIAPDEKAIESALWRGDVQFGYLSALRYVEASSKFDALNLLVRFEKGAPSNRAVILGKAEFWRARLAELKIPVSASGLKAENALGIIDSGRFVFVSRESDVGFFVPRQLLLTREIYPREAAFAGTDELVLQALDRELGVAGAVSESIFREKFALQTPLQPGMVVGNFLVLDLSQALPGHVIVARSALSKRTRDAVANALDACSKDGASEAAARIFGGDGFGTVSDRAFNYVRELYETQKTYVRVLNPRE
jgi:ABC-type phosphate/phosphonate transport system substrate-binding protein